MKLMTWNKSLINFLTIYKMLTLYIFFDVKDKSVGSFTIFLLSYIMMKYERKIYNFYSIVSSFKAALLLSNKLTN